MTMMSIQLRRVVYLLVLLQCFVCVSYAEGKEGVDSREPKRSEEERLEERLTRVVDRVYVTFVRGSGCLSLWKEVVGEFNNSVGGLPAIAGKSSEPVKTLAGIESLGGETVEKTTSEIKGGISALEDIVDAVEKTITLGKETRWVAINCLSSRGEWDGEKVQFASNIDYFAGLLGKGIEETVERMRLVRNCSKIQEEMSYLAGNLTAHEATSNFVLRGSDKALEAAKVAMETAITNLKKVKDLGGDHEGKYKDIKLQIEDVIKKGDAKVTELKSILKKLPFAKQQQKPTQGIGERLDKAWGGEARQKADEMVPKVNKMVEEELAKREEAKRLEKEEQERKARETQEQIEREQAQRAAEAEEQRKREEQAQKDAEVREQENNEQARRAREAREQKENEQAQKVRGAQDKLVEEGRAKEKAREMAEMTKKKDGSLSPALVHNPLLLMLLLCVLGCILVC
ncbi:uncharacterized protein TM35_000351010 [Trypanosoma theileri]|uniref:Uncharacterized protein n=1 Tax=Trypanosoma theileri TaxID=67003 RepID=A0A1X0NL36_9TRYP|nr:uncharacterized protein TM35_000351010 [Trypanosoma theileri]ORC85357.1 hypothetical protein TM35_000351010 [Trypanosoma theileri]